jgi:hypothetical protein
MRANQLRLWFASRGTIPRLTEINSSLPPQPAGALVLALPGGDGPAIFASARPAFL